MKKVWFADNNGGTNGDVLDITVIDSNIINPKYLYYVLSSETFFSYDMHNSKGAKMPRGDKNAVMKYRFTIPTIKIQNEITQILDKFDQLCTDISSGIPAEINARQKQYEYYRDQLLTFKHKSE